MTDRVEMPAGAVEEATAAAAAAKAASQSGAQRPEYVPEKFWKDGKADLEGLAKSYAELETKLSQGTKPAEEKPKGPVAIDKAGVDLAKLAAEFRSNDGQLTEATLKDLEQRGVPKAAVETYIAGVKAQVAAREAELVKLAGGQEAVNQIYSWAQANLTPDEIAAYDATMQQGDMVACKAAIEGLKARYTLANGFDPALISGPGSGSQGSTGFASAAEVTKAISDPRYQHDPAYRKQVEQRIAQTRVLQTRAY